MYKKTANGWIKHFDFMLWDLISLQFSLLLAYWIRHGIRNMYSYNLYVNMAIVLVLIDLVSVVGFETMHNVLKRGYWVEFTQTVKQVTLVVVMSSLYLFTIQAGEDYSRFVLGMTGIIYLWISYITRLIWKKHLKAHMKSGGKRALMIITTSELLSEVENNIEYHNYEMFHIAGIVVIDKNMNGKAVGSYQIVANADTVIDYVQNCWVDEVFINTHAVTPQLSKISEELVVMGIVVHTRINDTLETSAQKCFIEKLGKYNVLTTTINYADSRQLLMKRCLDIIGGIVGCFITGILFLFLAPAIYIQSPGPIFFSQVRVGKNGKRFKLYKFRSMYMDAEERKKELLAKNKLNDNKMFKLDWDPRIIGSKTLPDGTHKKGIGNLIRDWSLDEFPQFLNVLKGDLSLVGTRPPLEDEVSQYALHHHARLAMKPGITGLWQVSGRGNITDFEDVVKLDMEYIDNWSFGLDLRILFKTILVVLKKEGSM